MEATPNAKERLISSAALLFHINSYAAVGVQELCDHADIRRGSFYYYFPSKEALALSVLEHEAHQLIKHVFEPAFDNSNAPLERFDRLVQRLHDYHTRRIEDEDGVGGCPISNLGQELGSQYERIRRKAAGILDGFKDVYAQAIADAIAQGELPPDTYPIRTAERVLAYVQGMLEAAKLQNDADVLLRLGIDVAGLAVHGGTGPTPTG